jgi:hypothetical protein
MKVDGFHVAGSVCRMLQKQVFGLAWLNIV